MELPETSAALTHPALAQPVELQGPDEVRSRLGRPRGISTYFGTGNGGRQRAVLHHVPDGVIKTHFPAMQRGVHDDPGGPEDPGVKVAQLFLWTGEKALSAHHRLRVQGPALDEISGCDDLAERSKSALGISQLPMVPGVRLVDGDGWHCRPRIVGQKLFNLLGRRARGRERDKEMPLVPLGKRWGLLVARYSDNGAQELGRGLD